LEDLIDKFLFSLQQYRKLFFSQTILGCVSLVQPIISVNFNRVMVQEPIKHPPLMYIILVRMVMGVLRPYTQGEQFYELWDPKRIRPRHGRNLLLSPILKLFYFWRETTPTHRGRINPSSVRMEE
jgi:hypothetical protein